MKLTAISEDIILEQKTMVVSVPIIVNGKEEWEVEEILNS